jgi:hypothetical protein
VLIQPDGRIFALGHVLGRLLSDRFGDPDFTVDLPRADSTWMISSSRRREAS